MLSTRVKLTAAFIAGLVAVTITLFLAVLAARNDAVYHDIAQYAAAQGDLAARVITDAEQSGERVFASDDTALIQALSPNVVDRLQSIPGYIVVVDNQGRAVYRSSDVMRLQGGDMVTLQTQLADLPKSGEALIFSLDSLQEKLLFVSHSLSGSSTRLSRIASGGIVEAVGEDWLRRGSAAREHRAARIHVRRSDHRPADNHGRRDRSVSVPG